MERYSFGRKAVAVVLHQLFFVSMVLAFFIMDFFAKSGNMQYAAGYGCVGLGCLFGSFLLLAYLTKAAGSELDSKNQNALWGIDRIYVELLTMLCVAAVWFILHSILQSNVERFSFAGILLVAGTVGYMLDTIFLVYDMSIVRRIKAGCFFTRMGVYHLALGIRRLLQKKQGEALSREEAMELQKLIHIMEELAEGKTELCLDVREFHGQSVALAEAINKIKEGMKAAIASNTKNERLKADLITNVSHDLKTPLTSIVNYVDLLKREELENEHAKHYIKIIEEKAWRLKQLTEDLVEASKISSGNMKLDMQKIDFVELLYQTGGEFDERFEARGLTIVTRLPNEPVLILADGRQLYRAIENLYTNAAKYAMEHTRVYVELVKNEAEAVFTIKNVSSRPVEMAYEAGGNELAERFVRGESSRTTEGSGLGLSIARDLCVLMGADFEIQAEAELFHVRITFKMA
jgi:signal transduction histidine kinase